MLLIAENSVKSDVIRIMPSIVLVEDDDQIAKLLCQFLDHEGFDVARFSNGEEGIKAIIAMQPDMAILDMILPGIDGIEVCKAVREEYANCLLMLTANDFEMNEMIALNAGIDDYVLKPVRPHILLARINALLRRQGSNQPSTLIKLLDLEIDADKRKVIQSNSVLNLTDAEFELLWILASRAGNIITREELFEKVRGREYDGLDRSIDMRVSKLRKLLHKGNPEVEYIHTIRQRGYLFIKDR